MPNPKRRHSKQKTRSRRGHINLTPPTLVPCETCSEPKLPHTACGNCGNYAGESRIEVE